MNKIIINSTYLHRILYELITPLIPEQDEFEIPVKCRDGELSFANSLKISVESRSNWEVELRIGYLRKLFKLLTRIEEQPLTISFNNSHGWIEIFSVLV